MRIVSGLRSAMPNQPPFAATPRLPKRITVADATEAQLIYALPRALAAGDNYAVQAIRLRLRGAYQSAAFTAPQPG